MQPNSKLSLLRPIPRGFAVAIDEKKNFIRAVAIEKTNSSYVNELYKELMK